MDKLCKCGCGEKIKLQYHHKWRGHGIPNFILGHNRSFKGKTHSLETKMKLSLANKGHPCWCKGTKGVMKPNECSFKKGMIPWNKGKKGCIPWNKSRIGIYSEETLKKMSVNRKGIPSLKKGKTGIYSKETLEKMSYRKIGNKSPTWQGGTSFEPYTPDFNKRLKGKIRERDNHTCQECHYTEQELGYKLTIHHIDYNKSNSNPRNLISLCRSCHSKTNFGRNDWIDYFNNKNIKEGELLCR